MTTPDPFDGVPAPLADAMKARGFTELTAIQKAALEPGHEGRNLRISSVTGSGKTIALGLVLASALLETDGAPNSGPMVLVIAPTRELAMQVRGELDWLYAKVRGVHVEVVTGGVDIRGDRQRLARRPKVLVATPGRLLDHMRTGAVDVGSVAHVVLDEADQMLDMGFRDELEAIMTQLPEERASHLVSATFPPAVKRLADRFQSDAVQLQGTALGAPNQNIEHTAYIVSNQNFYAALVNLLLLAQGRRCLVFVQRRVDAAELSAKLAGDGFSALPFSGDLSQAQRTRTLEAFRHGIVNTLISTDVAARGIDVADIATVVHADPPSDAANYTHRSGRTGRAGLKGTSLILLPPKAERYVRSMLRNARVEATWGSVPSPKKVEKALRKRTRRLLHALLDAQEDAGQAAKDETEVDAVPAEVDAVPTEVDGDPTEASSPGTDEAPAETAEAKPKSAHIPAPDVGEIPTLTDADREYAVKLLDERDPVTLVATLLEMAKPTLAREPMAIVEGRSFRDRDDRSQGRGRNARGPDCDRPDKRGRREPGGRDARGDGGGGLSPVGEDFVRFEINWGQREGATPGRLLAHLCRRGEITSRYVGAVSIGRRDSTFEVAKTVAEDFGQKVAVTDARDPNLKISRAD